MFKCLNLWNAGISVPWEQGLVLARDHGFAGLDCDLDTGRPASYYKELYALHGLRPGGMALPVEWRGSQEEFQQGLSVLPAVARLGADVGLTRFYMWIWPFHDELAYRANFAYHLQRLGPCAKVLADHGCRLGLEFLGPKTLRSGHKHAFIRTMEQMLELCEAVGPNCGLLLDSWHWHTSLGNTEDIEALTDAQVVYVHVSDAPAGLDVDQQQDTQRRLPGCTGVIDIGGFMSALRKINYDGPVVCEPFEASLRQMPAEQAAGTVGRALDAIWSTQLRPALPTRMKVVATGGGKAWLTEQDVPAPEGNQVIVKIHAAPICGSNMWAFHGQGEWVNNGHEASGEVVAVARSQRVKVGDRVVLAPLAACGICEKCLRGDVIFCINRPAIHGMFAQYTRVADAMCVRLADDIDYVLGSLMCCCLGPPYEAIKRLAVRAYDTLVISGLGPVGMGATALAVFSGVRVIAIDPVPYRLEKARDIGAEIVLSPDDPQFRQLLMQATNGRGVMAGVECSGRSEALRLLIDLAGIRGKIAIIGENQAQVPIVPSDDFIRKGTTLLGCWHMNLNDAADLQRFIRRRRGLASKLVSHTFGFDQVQQAFETFASRQSVKVVLLPNK